MAIPCRPVSLYQDFNSAAKESNGAVLFTLAETGRLKPDTPSRSKHQVFVRGFMRWLKRQSFSRRILIVPQNSSGISQAARPCQGVCDGNFAWLADLFSRPI